MFKQTKVATVIGWVFSVLVALMLTMSATMKLRRPPEVVENFVGKMGYPESTLSALAITEITCLVLYLVPQTAVLGAVLLTGYFGGAVATHVRVQEGFAPAVIAGVFVWLGLFLRDPHSHSVAAAHDSGPGRTCLIIPLREKTRDEWRTSPGWHPQRGLHPHGRWSTSELARQRSALCRLGDVSSEGFAGR